MERLLVAEASAVARLLGSSGSAGSSSSGGGGTEDAAVVAADAALQHAVDALAAQQRAQTALQARAAELAAEDARLLRIAALLQQAEARLDAILADATAVLERARAAKPVDAGTAVAYARKVSYTAGPPPFWDGRGPLAPHQPPVPTEAAIRASLLYQTFLAARGHVPESVASDSTPAASAAAAPPPTTAPPPSAPPALTDEQRRALLNLDLL